MSKTGLRLACMFAASARNLTSRDLLAFLFLFLKCVNSLFLRGGKLICGHIVSGLARLARKKGRDTQNSSHRSDSLARW